MGAPPQIVVVCEIREDFEVSWRRASRAGSSSILPTMAASATPTPRLLHYMFLSLVPPGAPPRPANLSRAYDYWMRSCVRANPAYKIVLWTRDDCDRLIATRLVPVCTTAKKSCTRAISVARSRRVREGACALKFKINQDLT